MATDDTANDSTKATAADADAVAENSTPSPDPAAKGSDAEKTVDTNKTVVMPTAVDTDKTVVMPTAVDTDKTVTMPTAVDTEKTVTIDKSASAPAPAAPAVAESAPAKSRGAWLVAAAAGVAAVALGTALAVFVVLWSQRGEKIDAAKDATAAACDFVRTVSVFDGNGDLKPYFEGVEAKSTGELQSSFRTGTEGLRSAMVEIGAKSTIEELQCAPISVNDDQVMVAGTWIQYQSNKLAAEARPMIFPVQLTVNNVDGKWLVSMMKSPILDRLGMGGTMGGVAPGAAPAPAPGN
ncbi:hypothetical protein ACFWU5_26730 [Nocardia sp. NPDC058640]|uniref:hypothetical protein n=1 Tax=Nocardia sp. NPDC058640 TaxID=3346571 RepID=UPI00364A58C4